MLLLIFAKEQHGDRITKTGLVVLGLVLLAERMSLLQNELEKKKQ